MTTSAFNVGEVLNLADVSETLPSELLFPEVLLKTLDDYKTNKVI